MNTINLILTETRILLLTDYAFCAGDYKSGTSHERCVLLRYKVSPNNEK